MHADGLARASISFGIYLCATCVEVSLLVLGSSIQGSILYIHNKNKQQHRGMHVCMYTHICICICVFIHIHMPICISLRHMRTLALSIGIDR